MAVKISFDKSYNPELPTLILATRSGNKLGQIDYRGLVIKDYFNSPSELTFEVNKYKNNKKNHLWDEIDNLRLLWVADWDVWFQIKVDVDEDVSTSKSVSAIRLGQAELSQIMLYDIEINTETDISRDDYKIPTTFWNPQHPEASLLHRLMEKAHHYSIIHVDDTLKDIQRTWSFNDKSLYDSFQEIAEELGCLFVYHSCSDNHGRLTRTISVYDISSNCLNCGNRGAYISKCPKCGSTRIWTGYGEDTTIFVTSDELSTQVKMSTDTDSIKNCFRLEAGDDLMTATVKNCNPNGSDYIWLVSDFMKRDMSNALKAKLIDYNNLFQMYETQYQTTIGFSLLSQYNTLVRKYQQFNEDLEEIESPIVGYPALMQAYYNTIDFHLYLKSGLMPNVVISPTDAIIEAGKLTTANLSPCATTSVRNLSLSTANSVVLSVAKVIVRKGYNVEVNQSSLVNTTRWQGNFKVTNYSDDTDTAISETITVDITDEYEDFVKQKIDKALKQQNADDLSITGLFSKEYSAFVLELKKYGLNSLIRIHDACQACIDILVEQGVGDNNSWDGYNPNLYDDLYMPYYRKLGAIESEMRLRENELSVIEKVQDSIIKSKNYIQNALDFESFLGSDLWLEFSAFRREDKYRNENYISDGLDNAELFKKALEFIDEAQAEITKACEMQHSIDTTLKNLLVIEKFKPLTDMFEVGNYIRVQIDDNVYKLRLLDYEIDFDNLEKISVTLSDVVTETNYAEKAIKNAMQSQAMATSYGSTKRQAKQGANGSTILDRWVANGLDTTNVKIMQGSDNQTQSWDEHGMLFRQYDDVFDEFSSEQLKIINSTMAITNDNWETVKTAVGGFYYINPANGRLEYAYGINAEVVIGKLVLGEQLGIYNTGATLKFDKNGLNITNGINSFVVNPNNSQSLLAISKGDDKVLYVDANGLLHITGDGSGLDISNNSKFNDYYTSSEVDQQFVVYDREIRSSISQTYETKQDATSKLNTANQNAQGYANTAEANANNATDTKLTNYYTKTETNSEISQSASEIALSVSQTYETKQDATSKLNTAKDYADAQIQVSATSIRSYVNGRFVTDTEMSCNIRSYSDYTDGSINGLILNSNFILGNNELVDGIRVAVWVGSEFTNTQLAKDKYLGFNITSSAGVIMLVAPIYYQGNKPLTDEYKNASVLHLIYKVNVPIVIREEQGGIIVEHTENYTGFWVGGDESFSQITQTANSIRSEVTNLGQNLTSLITQNANSITAEVIRATDAESAETTRATNAETALGARITLTENSIISTVASSVKDYDTSSLSYTIDYYGFDTPANSGYDASDYNNKYFLNQKNGYVYKSNGTDWVYQTHLTLMTANLQSQITQNANSITTKVGNDEIISKINQTAESITIEASKINLNGAVSLNGTFSISQQGNMSAIGGTIGGWVINSSGLYKEIESGNIKYRPMIYAPTSPALSTLAFGIRKFENDAYTYPFYVNYNGKLYANNAEISGKIIATSGKIGSWDITTGKIYAGDSTTGVAVMQMPSSSVQWVFAAGGTSHSSYADCPFRVDKAGNLYATKANITGSVNASSLKFTTTLQCYDGYRSSTYNFYQHYSDAESYGSNFRNGNGTIVMKFITYDAGDWSGYKGALIGRWYLGSSSSRTIKKNIEEISAEEANKIYKLSPVKFDMKESKTNNQRERGLIAEDTIKVIPDIVRKMDEGDSPYSIDYIALIPYLIKVAQEQKKEIDYLKQMIK